MTLRDPGNFPKYLNGFHGLGRQGADDLDNSEAPYLRKRVQGGAAQAIKKGEFLYVRRLDAELTVPFLWALVPRSGDSLNNPRAYVLASNAAMRNRFVQQDTRQVVAGMARNDFNATVFVGDGYVLRLNTAYLPTMDGGDVVAWTGVCWPSLAKIGSTAAEVLSLSGGNVAGANVSFADALLMDVARPTDSESTQPNIVAMGWDESVQGYAFGIFKRDGADVEPVPPAPTPLKFFYGDTGARTLTAVTLPAHPGGEEWRSARCWCVGPGQLLALAVPFGMAYPDAPSFLRSSDFGRTWSRTDASELVPYLLRVEDSLGAIDYRVDQDAVCLPWTFVASPLGEGRVAIAVSGSRLHDAPIPYEVGHDTTTDARWKFFVSGPDGTGFVNKPWPPDSWFGFYQNRDMDIPIPARWTPQTPHLACAHQALQNTQLSCGPGTFFLTASELLGPDPRPVNSYEIVQRLRVLSTRDFGDTWTLSDEIPQNFVSPHSHYQLATFAVASRRTLFLAATFTTGPMRVVRTNRFFSGFALGATTEDEELLSDMADFHFFDDYFGDVFDPPVSHAIRPLYIGAAGTPAVPRVHAGYPGDYDRP